MSITNFVNENAALSWDGEQRARLALEIVEKTIDQSNVNDEQKKLLLSFAGLLSQAIEDNDTSFVDGAKDTIDEIIGSAQSEEIDLLSIDTESSHAFPPILKSDEEVAKMATSVHSYLFMYKGEKDMTLSTLIYKFMREKGIDNPADVWKPVGLGRKNWHNLLTRYENEEGKRAKKLTLLQVAIGLRLNIEETKQLLENQFHRLTKSQTDLIFTYYIVNRAISVENEKDHAMMAKKEADAIRDVLDEYNLETLSANYE